MTTANVSEDENQNNSMTFKQFFCSPDLRDEIHGQLTFILVLNAFLAATAFLGNALILVTLRKECSFHLQSKVLLGNLATTDLCVGLISEPLYVTLLVTVLQEHLSLPNRPSFCHKTILCGMSLFTLTTISAGRLLALLLGLKYREIVSLKRTNVVVMQLSMLCPRVGDHGIGWGLWTFVYAPRGEF